MRKFTDPMEVFRLTRSYREIFRSEAGKRVLRDLAKVCHAASTTFDENPSEQARKEGKRQIWLRIQNMINLSDDEITALTKGE